MEVIGLNDKKALINPKYGTLAGLKIHIVRLYHGVLDEFLELIKMNKQVLEIKFMKDILKNIKKDNREYWEDLVKLSNHEKKVNRLRDVAATIRNNVTFHYAKRNLDQLIVGYKVFFKDNIQGNTEKNFKYAYVSRGNSMRHSRFFFADAMVDAYIETLIQKHKEQYNEDEFYSSKEFADKLGSIFNAINNCLQNIIDLFLQRRNWQGQPVDPETEDMKS